MFIPLDVCERVTHLNIDYKKLYYYIDYDIDYDYIQKFFSDEDCNNLYKLNEALDLYGGHFTNLSYIADTNITIPLNEHTNNNTKNKKNDNSQAHYQFHRVGEQEILTTISKHFLLKIVSDLDFRNQFTVDYIKYLLSIRPAIEIYNMPLFSSYLRIIHSESVE